MLECFEAIEFCDDTTGHSHIVMDLGQLDLEAYCSIGAQLLETLLRDGMEF